MVDNPEIGPQLQDCFGGAAQLTPTGSGRQQDRGREAAFLENGLLAVNSD
jgi:hypothetical protein